jgi:hypothetical protein
MWWDLEHSLRGWGAYDGYFECLHVMVSGCLECMCLECLHFMVSGTQSQGLGVPSCI